MKIRITLSLFLVAVFVFGFSLWWRESTQVLNPQDKTSKIFVVAQGENVRQVALRLEGEGLIRSKIAFFLLIKKESAEKNIQAGTFRLSASMTPDKILDELAHGTLDIWVTIVEGLRNEEIASLLEDKLDFSSEDFLKVSKVGYMFPDTYAFPKQASAGAVAQIMVSNFREKFDPQLKEAAQKEGLNEGEVLILASIVEREAKYDEDRPIVAGILLNRIKQDMPLQADATVQYALGYQAAQKTWWKKDLTKEDLKIASPYNTYLNSGFPPTSISNPGLSTIRAAAQPAKTDYLYYLSDKEGRMHYAQTFSQHTKNIQKYLSN